MNFKQERQDIVLNELQQEKKYEIPVKQLSVIKNPNQEIVEQSQIKKIISKFQKSLLKVLMPPFIYRENEKLRKNQSNQAISQNFTQNSPHRNSQYLIVQNINKRDANHLKYVETNKNLSGFYKAYHKLKLNNTNLNYNRYSQPLLNQFSQDGGAANQKDNDSQGQIVVNNENLNYENNINQNNNRFLKKNKIIINLKQQNSKQSFLNEQLGRARSYQIMQDLLQAKREKQKEINLNLIKINTHRYNQSAALTEREIREKRLHTTAYQNFNYQNNHKEENQQQKIENKYNNYFQNLNNSQNQFLMDSQQHDLFKKNSQLLQFEKEGIKNQHQKNKQLRLKYIILKQKENTNNQQRAVRSYTKQDQTLNQQQNQFQQQKIGKQNQVQDGSKQNQYFDITDYYGKKYSEYNQQLLQQSLQQKEKHQNQKYSKNELFYCEDQIKKNKDSKIDHAQIINASNNEILAWKVDNQEDSVDFINI